MRGRRPKAIRNVVSSGERAYGSPDRLRRRPGMSAQEVRECRASPGGLSFREEETPQSDFTRSQGVHYVQFLNVA